MRPCGDGHERDLAVDETVASNPGAAASDAMAHTLASQPQLASANVAPDAARRSDARSPDYDELTPVAPEHYVLDGTIARGGMGQIIRARDRRLGRAVAIKELRVSTPDLVVRFRREVKITARLQHPSIVAVHEAGLWPSGEPFFAMEMIAGQPFDAVIRATTTWRERVALLPHMLAVADALAYAHSRGVIHRDLKPANVLVGEFGETVVIDWGLARDVQSEDGAVSVVPELPSDGPNATVAGAVLGTPIYMPPEQARGERVDERADVYAIGAMLYHLLTGKPPYAGKTVEEILAAVMARPPRPLQTVEPEAPSDLVAIVEKAMAREPSERYATGRSLADDLRRFQTGQLVGAHRYTRRERLRRFVRAYRLPLVVGGIACVLLAGIGVFSVSRIVDERDTAREARELAETRGREAAAQRDAAEKLVGYMLADLKPSLERVGRLDVMKGVSKEVDGYYSQLGTTTTLDAAAVARRAEAVRTLGDVLDAGGDIAGARRSYEHAIAMLESQASPDPIALAGARTDLAIMLEVQGDLDAAWAALQRAEETIATAATVSSWQATFAKARLGRWQGIVLLDRGDSTAALVALDRAIEVGIAGARTHPRSRELRFELSKAHDRRSDGRNAVSNTAGALADAKASLAIREQLEREDPQDLPVRRAIAVSWDKLFNLAIVEERIADAEQAATRQIEIVETLVRHDPSNRAWMLNLIIALTRPADLAFERDDFQEAARRQARVVTMAKQLVDLDPSNLEARIELGKAMIKLGESVLYAGEHDRALSTLRSALGMFEQLAIESPANPDHPAVIGEIQEIIGNVYAERADAANAIDAFGKSLAIAEASLRASPGAREKVAVATKQFALARAIANVPARQAEGVAGMQRAIAVLRELERAKELTPYDIERLPELERQAKAYRFVRKR